MEGGGIICSLATSGRFLLLLKSKACRLAPLQCIHSCLFVHIGVAKSKMYSPPKEEILKGRWGGGGSRLWNSQSMLGNAFWNF